MSKNLLLITQGFPYGESERGFLSAEFTRLAKEFQVSIIAIGTKEPLVYPLDESVQTEIFRYQSLRNAASLLDAMAALLHFSGEIIREQKLVKKDASRSLVISRYKQCLADLMNAWQIRKRIRDIILERKTDIIYTYWCTPATLAAVSLKKEFPNLKVITRFHGFDLYQERDSYGYKAFRPLIADLCDWLVFACETSKHFFVQQWGNQWDSKGWEIPVPERWSRYLPDRRSECGSYSNSFLAFAVYQPPVIGHFRDDQRNWKIPLLPRFPENT